MIERPLAAPASVEQLVQPDSSDISALIGLMRLENPLQKLRPSSEFESRIQEYLNLEQTALFVARAAINSYNDENGEVVGYAATREKPEDAPTTLHVEGLYMRPDGRNRSLGRGLIDLVIGHAKSRELERVQVDMLPQGAEGYRLLMGMDFHRQSGRGLFSRPVDA